MPRKRASSPPFTPSGEEEVADLNRCLCVCVLRWVGHGPLACDVLVALWILGPGTGQMCLSEQSVRLRHVSSFAADPHHRHAPSPSSPQIPAAERSWSQCAQRHRARERRSQPAGPLTPRRQIWSGQETSAGKEAQSQALVTGVLMERLPPYRCTFLKGLV